MTEEGKPFTLEKLMVAARKMKTWKAHVSNGTLNEVIRIVQREAAPTFLHLYNICEKIISETVQNYHAEINDKGNNKECTGIVL